MKRPLDFGSHHQAAILENIEFLRKNGIPDEAIAKRLGLKTKTLHKKEERNGKSPGTASS